MAEKPNEEMDSGQEMRNEIMDLNLDEVLLPAQLKMGMHVTEDLHLNLMSEQIVPVLEDINLVIKEAVLLNVEMEESIHQKRNVMIKILMIMMVAVPLVQKRLDIIEREEVHQLKVPVLTLEEMGKS